MNLPDVRGREAILKVHANNVKLAEAVDLGRHRARHARLFRRGTGQCLERSRVARRRATRTKSRQAELEEARDKVRWGRERRSLAMTEEEKKCTAWHEAGHALVNVLLEHTHPLHKVTIIPRGPSLGVTM